MVDSEVIGMGFEEFSRFKRESEAKVKFSSNEVKPWERTKAVFIFLGLISMRVQGNFELSKKSLLSWDLFHVKEHSSISGGVRRGKKKQDIQRKEAERT